MKYTAKVKSGFARTAFAGTVASLMVGVLTFTSQALTPARSSSVHLSNAVSEDSKCNVEYENELHSALRTIETKTQQKPAALCLEIVNGQLNLVLFTKAGKFSPSNSKAPLVSLEQLRSAVESLKEEVADFSKIDEDSYRPHAKQLYQWLIAPIENTLKQQNIDTLIFSVNLQVPLFPLEVLYNETNRHYLIEDYSISRILDLNQIIDFSQKVSIPYEEQDRSLDLVVMGASKYKDTESEAADLPGIESELQSVSGQWKRGADERIEGGEWVTNGDNSTLVPPLINRDFTIENIRSKLAKNSLDIVHIATHGVFNSETPSESYLRLWDSNLLFDDLQEMLKNREVELLVLSACNTASGNENGQLGLEKLVQERDIKTILATQWKAHHISAYIMMRRYPREFPGNRNLEFMRQPIWFYKAKALQQLQVNMLQKKIYLTKNGQMKVSISIGEEPASINLPSDLVQLVQASTEIQNNETEEFFFDHPYFWAAFTLIGSPW